MKRLSPLITRALERWALAHQSPTTPPYYSTPLLLHSFHLVVHGFPFLFILSFNTMKPICLLLLVIVLPLVSSFRPDLQVGHHPDTIRDPRRVSRLSKILASRSLLPRIAPTEKSACVDSARQLLTLYIEVIIQVFQWNYNSIADECERFIGPAGYGYVEGMGELHSC